jgi:hypothetical protein
MHTPTNKPRLFWIGGGRRAIRQFGDARMNGNSQDNYDIEYFLTRTSNNGQVSHFAPTLQSLKSAHDIVRRHEKRRQAAAKAGRRNALARGPALGGVVSDNIIPIHGHVWTRPSSRLIQSRRYSPAYDSLAHPPHARRASLQREARRLSRYVRVATPPSFGACSLARYDDVQDVALERFVVMAVQGLAIALGLSGLVVLLTLL